jgi:maltodextrin utilization protein YvdJ
MVIQAVAFWFAKCYETYMVLLARNFQHFKKAYSFLLPCGWKNTFLPKVRSFFHFQTTLQLMVDAMGVIQVDWYSACIVFERIKI